MSDLLIKYMGLFGTLFWIDFILAFLVILKEKRNPTSTILWVMVIMFLPIVGFLAYLIIGIDISKSKIFQSKAEDDSIKVAFAKDRIIEINQGTYEYNDPKSFEYIGLIKLLTNNSISKYTEYNKVDVITDGVDFMNDMVEEFKKAKIAIYIQFYIIKPGEFFDNIKKVLIEKAQEGVEVKILLDGMGGRNLKKDEINELKAAGIKVEIFFPPLLGNINVRVNYRNHRKIVVVDNNIGYLGGFNIGDEYISKSKKFGYWRDTHIKIKGEAVSDLVNRFYFDYKFASGEEDGRYQTSNIFNEDYDVAMNIISSGPDNDLEQIRDGYSKMIEMAKDRIYLQTPYFIPDEGLYKSLRMAAYSGVDLRIMVPEMPDHPFVKSASRYYLGELLRYGAKIYYYKDNGFLHAKTLLIDDFVSSVGTANFDIRSFKLNFEINAFVYDFEINKKLAQAFEKDMENCIDYNILAHMNRPLYQKFTESFSVLLSPLL